MTFVDQRSAPSCLSVFPVHDKGSLALNVPVTYSVKRLFNQRDVSYRDWHEKDEQTINQREQQRGKNDWIMLSAPFSPTRPSIQQILAWHGWKLKFVIKKICLYTHVGVRLTLSVYLCVTFYFTITKIDNLLMLPSPEMLKIIKMSVTKAVPQR